MLMGYKTHHKFFCWHNESSSEETLRIPYVLHVDGDTNRDSWIDPYQTSIYKESRRKSTHQMFIRKKNSELAGDVGGGFFGVRFS